MAERTRAERTLRAAQDELVQAGKLAVIGQLSSGMAHELNQPLAALRTLSGNARKFLARGDQETAGSNLERIADLVDRMGRLTGQLEIVCPQNPSGAALWPPLRRTVDNALFLLSSACAAALGIAHIDLSDRELQAWCDANRLEQVLVEPGR